MIAAYQATATRPNSRILCRAAGISRAAFYRGRARALALATPGEGVAELRDALRRVSLQWPSYGYRRVAAELRRRGHAVNHKRVLRLMREDNLLCLRRRAWVVTTDSGHALPVYPNLAREIRPTRLNQLWVADITYVRLLREFIYLAVILDAFSRRVIGWALEAYLDAGLALAALRMALASRRGWCITRTGARSTPQPSTRSCCSRAASASAYRGGTTRMTTRDASGSCTR
jgi:transposase InsO family protein